ncbi:unnamed protein product [Camellia sinensis]
MSNATKLHRLGLASSKFIGKVPHLSKLHDLQLLNFHGNDLGIGEADNLSFLYSLTNAINLYTLDLSNNNFEGLLPESIGNLYTNLGKLILSINDIDRIISTEIGNLINLKLLDLLNNNFTGNILADIGKFQKLQKMDLSESLEKYGMGNEVSTFGDVYSYGILLLEMFTGKRPTDNMFCDSLGLHNFIKIALPEQAASIIADPRLFKQKDQSSLLVIRNTLVGTRGVYMEVEELKLKCNHEQDS